jgi:SAM-dependent methyltransferase
MIEDLISELDTCQYSRYAAYVAHIDFIAKNFHDKQFLEPKIIEFGGSNSFVKNIFNHASYEIADNYPVVDLHDLSKFNTGFYDFVILDEILEHVARPWIAIKEVHRILKVGGCLLCSVPFLIAEHKCPNDYWRFTKEGLSELLSDFRDVEVNSWGNAKSVSYLLDDMMVSTRRAKQDGWFDLSNQAKYPITVWGYAWK